MNKIFLKNWYPYIVFFKLHDVCRLFISFNVVNVMKNFKKILNFYFWNCLNDKNNLWKLKFTNYIIAWRNKNGKPPSCSRVRIVCYNRYTTEMLCISKDRFVQICISVVLWTNFLFEINHEKNLSRKQRSNSTKEIKLDWNCFKRSLNSRKGICKN